MRGWRRGWWGLVHRVYTEIGDQRVLHLVVMCVGGSDPRGLCLHLDESRMPL